MPKTLLYRLFRIGALPRSERTGLESEGLCYLDEGIPLTISWRHYREPNRYIARHRQSLTGTVALTRRRLLIFAASQLQLELDLQDPASERIDVSQPTAGTFAVALNAEDFHPGCSGRITYWLSTAGASTLADLWQKRPAPANHPEDASCSTRLSASP